MSAVGYSCIRSIEVEHVSGANYAANSLIDGRSVDRFPLQLSEIGLSH